MAPIAPVLPGFGAPASINDQVERIEKMTLCLELAACRHLHQVHALLATDAVQEQIGPASANALPAPKLDFTGVVDAHAAHNRNAFGLHEALIRAVRALVDKVTGRRLLAGGRGEFR